MIREINVSEITAAIKEMCIQANHFLSPDMDKALKAATANEESPLGKNIKPATGKLKNSRRGYDTDMSGYRNGSFFHRNRPGCPFYGRRIGGCHK